MKKNYLYTLGLSLVALFSSCSGFLEENPHSFIDPNQYFNTYEEADAALLGVYNHLHNQQIGDFGWQFRGDAGVDVGICRNITRYNVYQYYEMEALPTQVVDAWRSHYKAVGDANMVINRTLAMNLPEEKKNLVIGQARFLRAYFYHQLTLMWGDVPLYTDEVTGANQAVIASLPRTPVKEVYGQMIEDLEFAAANLPAKYDPSGAGRITQSAAQGLLARIYLFDNQWENASKTAQELLKSTPNRLLDDYEEIFLPENSWNDEILFAVPAMKDVRGQMLHTVAEPATNWEKELAKHDFVNHPVVLPNGKLAKGIRELCPGWGIFYLCPEFVASFAEGDRRADATVWGSVTTTDGEVLHFQKKNDGTPFYNKKWISLDDTECNGDKDIILMRLAEVYLILAEAENELHKGPSEQAYAAINRVRSRAFGNESHNLSGLSYDTFRRAVIDENRWELGGEGLRAWYLRHWGYDELHRAVESVKATNPKAVQNIKPHHMLYKVPDEEFVKNPNLAPNNPGY